MKTNSQSKKGFKLLLGNYNHVPKGTRFKLLRKTTMFLGEKELLFPKDMIVPHENKFKLISEATSTPSPQGHDCSPEKKRFKLFPRVI